jgi:hypothetical protein
VSVPQFQAGYDRVSKVQQESEVISESITVASHHSTELILVLYERSEDVRATVSDTIRTAISNMVNYYYMVHDGGVHVTEFSDDNLDSSLDSNYDILRHLSKHLASYRGMHDHETRIETCDNEFIESKSSSSKLIRCSIEALVQLQSYPPLKPFAQDPLSKSMSVSLLPQMIASFANSTPNVQYLTGTKKCQSGNVCPVAFIPYGLVNAEAIATPVSAQLHHIRQGAADILIQVSITRSYHNDAG